jgi:threonine dehydrogenase-like Zn-dependent dehydrogenase
MLHGPGDIRLETLDDPQMIEPSDAIIRLSATCICGSDLWPYRGVDAIEGVMPMGHEYCGIVRDVGSAVTTIRPGQFVVGSFWASDGTGELCRAGYQSACGAIPPGNVFDLTLPLDDIAEGCRAMDERRAIKTLLQL